MQVCKEFLEGVPLSGTPWNSRDFGPKAAFFRLVYENLEFHSVTLVSPSRSHAIDIAREQRHQPHVWQVQKLHQQPFQPNCEATVWRHSVAKSL